ncbi:MAG TPA: choice-of-anchor Q domain-containing protein [Xanthomonadales bacterium]|nr:choice-of-anchor Q domain-containing protein [Xanthomonadales bacterium]
MMNYNWLNSVLKLSIPAWILLTSTVQAATINVTSNADNGTGCTLRNAVLSANGDIAVGGCAAGSGNDVINLSAISGQTITLTPGEAFGPIAIDETSTDSTTIEGAGVAIDGNGATRLFIVYTPTTLVNLDLQGGASAEGGGAINLAVFGNTLEIRDSILRNNTSTSVDAGSGGGAIILGSNSLIVKNSSFFGNTATQYGGAINGASGADIQLINTTFSENSAAQGGAVYLGGASLEVFQSTFTGNQSANGGALRSLNSTVLLVNSILANSISGNDCEATISTITHNGFNLVESKGSCELAASPDLLETDPMLGSYGANGGPTPTHLPQAGSPVIDAGNDADIPVGLQFDQRGPGFSRLAGMHVDLGSVEIQDPEQAGPDFIVTIADDVDDGLCRAPPGDCSLREALNSANANADASIISFVSALLSPPATITLAGTALPTVTTEVAIEGEGITVDADDSSRLFVVGASGNLTLRRFTLANGFHSVSGGGLSVDGQLTLIDSTLTGNASGFGGAIYVFGGVVELVNSTLSGNSATTSGGGMWTTGATVTMHQTTISGNSSPSGAGILSSDSGTSFTLANSVLANSSGGGADCRNFEGSFTLLGVNLIENQGDCGIPSGAELIEGTDPLLGPLGDNGGLTHTLLPSVDSPLRNAGVNGLATETYDQRGPGFARIFGGTVDLGAVELQVNPQTGPDFVVNNLEDTSDGYCDIAPDSCSLREALLAANANADASSISFANELLAPGATITLAGTALPTVSTEVVINAAGITVDGDDSSRIFYADPNGILTLRRISLANGFDAIAGGAVRVDGQMTIMDSTLTGNASSFGGAIYVTGGSLELTNSTVSGNTASTSGGGMWTSSATVALRQTTISGNSSASGGGLLNVESTFTLANSVVANSQGGGADCTNSDGTFTLLGVNLVENQGDCGLPGGINLIQGTDPQLGALGNYGGPTPTLLPAVTSPIVDAGDNSFVPVGLDFDQRGSGFPRIQGDSVDLGSIEFSDLVFSDGFESPPE